MENIRVHTFRTDGGGELVNTVLETFLNQKGCQLQLTAMRTPEQNPVAERAMRTIKEGVRCMLMDADLAPEFWEDAAEYFIFMKNRTMHKGTKPTGKTPYEAYR